MVDPKLVNYIKTQLSIGTSVDQIKNLLISRGWKIPDINLACMIVTPQSTYKYQQTYQKSTNQSSKLWMLLALGIIFVVGGVLALIFLIVKANG